MTAFATARPLAEVVDHFVAELNDIESVFGACRGDRSVYGYLFPYTPSEDGCLISMWDAWNRFLRALILAGAAGPVQGLGGGVYSQPNPQSEAQVLADLFANKRGNNFKITNGEPRWYDPACIADIMSHLGLANEATVVGALGSTSVTLGPATVTNPLEEIRICRNFVAHKSDSTLRNVHTYAPNGFADLSTHLRGRRSGVEAFSEWRDCLVAIAEAAGQ